MACKRCGGRGVMHEYRHVEGGRCFDCTGGAVVVPPKRVFAPRVLSAEEVRERDEGRVRRAARDAAYAAARVALISAVAGK